MKTLSADILLPTKPKKKVYLACYFINIQED